MNVLELVPLGMAKLMNRILLVGEGGKGARRRGSTRG